MPNVATDPLITVHAGGRSEPVGLRGLFTDAHRFDGLSGYVAPAEAGMLRLLIALAARLTGLDTARSSSSSWDERRDAVLAAGAFDPERVEHYFSRFEDRFELLGGPRPFLQDPRLVDECPSTAGINRLVPYRPTGNTQPWMCPTLPADNEPVSLRDALAWLLVQHYYGPAGGGSSRKMPRSYLERTGVNNKVAKAQLGILKAVEVTDAKQRKKAVATATRKLTDTLIATTYTHYLKAAPLRATSSVFLWGRDLFETLVVNIPHPELCDVPEGDDVAPWEADALSDSDLAPAVTWPMRLLVGRSRHALLLVGNDDDTEVVDTYLTWGHMEAPAFAMDPYLTHWAPKKPGELPSPPMADPSRPVWRDLSAILGPVTDDARLISPVSVRQTAGMPPEVVKWLRLRVLTYEQDRKTRDLGWLTTVTPEVLSWTAARDPEAAKRIAALADAASEVGSGLRWGLVTAWEAVNGEAPTKGKTKTCPWAVQALAVYWPRAENLFWQMTHDGVTPHPTMTTPFAALAREAMSEALSGWSHTPMAAVALARADRFVASLASPKRRRGATAEPDDDTDDADVA